MEPILRNSTSADWMTLLIFGSLVLVVIAKSTFYSRFLNFIILPFNNKYIFMYNKKEKLLNWFNIFFTLFQVINISLFIYLCLGWYYEENQATLGQTAYVYPWILMAVIGFLAIKSVLQLGNALIFNSGGVIGEVVFKKISYLNFSAVIAFLANILLCYVFKNSTVIVYGAGLLILLINALGWWAVLKNHQKFLVDNFLYFILYLCALEIAPLIIIGSYLND